MYTKFDLTGKVALVVGGHGGIGKAIALGLADAGADVAVASRNLEALKAVTAEIESKGKKSLAVSVDVVDGKMVNAMVDAVLKVFPRIDILVNSAGLAIRKPADTFPIDEWQKVMDINTRGTFLCCQAVGRVMLKQKIWPDHQRLVGQGPVRPAGRVRGLLSQQRGGRHADADAGLRVGEE
jgi:2-deoxy-D-gluconate 3-dehydrogenase